MYVCVRMRACMLLYTPSVFIFQEPGTRRQYTEKARNLTTEEAGFYFRQGQQTSLLHSFHNRYGFHPASYPTGTDFS